MKRRLVLLNAVISAVIVGLGATVATLARENPTWLVHVTNCLKWPLSRPLLFSAIYGAFALCERLLYVKESKRRDAEDTQLVFFPRFRGRLARTVDILGAVFLVYSSFAVAHRLHTSTEILTGVPLFERLAMTAVLGLLVFTAVTPAIRHWWRLLFRTEPVPIEAVTPVDGVQANIQHQIPNRKTD